MKKFIVFFKSNSLWIQVMGTIIASVILWVVVFIWGILKGLNYQASIRWTWDILNLKISLLWFLIFSFSIIILIRRLKIGLLEKMGNLYCSKDEFEKKIATKLDLSTFESFEDAYNCRRLETHPWHNLYLNDEIKTYKYMLWKGNNKPDLYKVDNAIQGLLTEINRKGYISNSEKTEIVNELKDCYKDSYNSNKEELVRILDTIKTI